MCNQLNDFVLLLKFLSFSGEELCIFGVPLGVAVERQRCHDGVPLPMVVRLCIDYVEEHGLMLEGIYRSSGKNQNWLQFSKKEKSVLN